MYMGEQTQGTLGLCCRGACVERIGVTRNIKECLHIAGIKGGNFLEDMPARQGAASHLSHVTCSPDTRPATGELTVACLHSISHPILRLCASMTCSACAERDLAGTVTAVARNAAASLRQHTCICSRSVWIWLTSTAGCHARGKALAEGCT